MDRFDDRILHELKLKGRLSNVELAERIGLSPRRRCDGFRSWSEAVSFRGIGRYWTRSNLGSVLSPMSP
ncbi:AsnC family transcriptional regulator [Dongshaea marina]|uniref:AsnC family transcriptional regulator n=1 Tax=Dongshaea marina TaxID=2047966 RepID=UPI001901F67C